MADFSAANRKFVFPAFIYALGTRTIQGYNDGNVNVSFITKPIPFTGNDQFDCMSPYMRYKDFQALEEGTVQDSLQYVTNVYDISVNKDTDSSSMNTLEGLRNTPPEYYLFTKGYKNKISGCAITADYDYTVSALKNKRLSAYFRGEYELSGGYDEKKNEVTGYYTKQKYYELGIPEDYVTESKPCKTADAFEFQDRDDLIARRVDLFIKGRKEYIKTLTTGVKGTKGTKGNKDRIVTTNANYDYDGHCLGYGALGFILSYADDTHANGNMIPMAYYEFPKPIYSNCDYLKINWNTNGFIEAQ